AMPGQPKTFSTRKALPSMAAKSRPRTVRVGIMAGLKAYFMATVRSRTPKARAISTYGLPSVSSMFARVRRAACPRPERASAKDGSRRCLRASQKASPRPASSASTVYSPVTAGGRCDAERWAPQGGQPPEGVAEEQHQEDGPHEGGGGDAEQ